MMIDGWFLSRSTMRTARSRKAVAPIGVAGQLGPVAHALETVRLLVGLVNHVQPKAVAQVEPARIVRGNASSARC